MRALDISMASRINDLREKVQRIREGIRASGDLERSVQAMWAARSAIRNLPYESRGIGALTEHQLAALASELPRMRGALEMEVHKIEEEIRRLEAVV